jgi:antitoxin component of RelBE/YafQ-DinJ toxin-antitoxin module
MKIINVDNLDLLRENEGVKKMRDLTERKYRNVNLSLDSEATEKAKVILKEEMGMTLSKFIDIQLRSLVRARTGTVSDFMEGTLKEYVDADKTLTNTQREKVNGILFDAAVVNVKKKKKK